MIMLMIRIIINGCLWHLLYVITSPINDVVYQGHTQDFYNGVSTSKKLQEYIWN